jgi:hypothetical protein
MQDDKGTPITVTILSMGTATAPVSEVGEVETGMSKPAVEAKTSPAFRISITRVGSSG